MITGLSRILLIILLIDSYHIQAKSPSMVSFPSGSIECFCGESIKLKCRAEGSKPIIYSWFRNGLEISQKNLIKLNHLSLIDQGDYICIARNEFGADTGSVCRVIIKTGVKAFFSAKPIKGSAPLSVHFTNLSKGTFSESVWDFGDSSYCMEKSPVHVYQKTGVYSVILKVRKADQSDSIIQKEIIKVFNPINQNGRDLRQKRELQTYRSPESIKKTISFPPPLFFKGLHLGADSTRIAFNNMQSKEIDTLILWYGLKPHPLFSDKKHVKKIDPSFFWTDTPKDSIILTLKDTLFSQKADSGYCALIMVSKKHFTSDTFITSFQLLNGNNVPPLHESYVVTKLPVRITNAKFNHTTHLMNINWESFIKKASKISIYCSTEKKIANPEKFLVTKNITGEFDSLELDIDKYLSCDTLYELSLWISDSSGIMFVPDNNGRLSFQLNRKQWRSFFLSDSQPAPFFNNSVLLRKKNGDSLIGKINLEKYKTFPGMICAGNVIGISIQNHDAELEAGFPLHNCDGSRSSISHLYYLGRNGLFVFKDYFDSSKGIIWTQVKSNYETLIYPLIDTIHPKITILSDTSSIALPGSVISDTLIVSDNISNCRWKFFTRDAASSEISIDSGSLSSTVDTLIFRVPVKKDSLNYLWSRFVVCDGTWSDTVNISRKFFQFGREIPVKRMNWIPVISTSFRRFSSAESVFTQLCPENKWEYDPYRFRLFRLTVPPLNKSPENSWIEYSDQNSRLFAIEPGKVIWLKSGSDGTIRFGAGFSIPLKDSFSIVLQPKSWNDFALPYQHPITLNQILKSTGEDSDSLEFFIWSEGKLGTSYYLSPIFIKGLTTEYSSSLLPQKPYSVYNPFDRRITMKIPAESFLYDTIKTDSVKKYDGWILRLTAFDKSGESFDEAWCGMRSEISEDHLYISPVSLSKIKMSFVGENSCSTGGYLLCPINSSGHGFHLRISNGSEITESISLNKDIIGAFPDSFNIKFFLASGEIAEDSCLKIDPGREKDIWIAAGTKEYVAYFKDSVETIKSEISSVSISNDSVYVKIQLPFSGIDNVVVSLSDSQNKIVWHQSFQSITGGTHTFFWDGITDRYTRAPAGFYILDITGYSISGDSKTKTSKNFLYLRNSDDDF